MVSWSSVAASWGLFGAIVILGWWYYTKDGRRRRGGRTTDILPLEQSDRRPAGSKPKRRKEKDRGQPETSEPASSDVAEASVSELNNGARKQEKPRSRKRDRKQKFVPLPNSSAIEISPSTTKAIGTDDSEHSDAKEFARRMAKAKEGTTFNPPQKGHQRLKTQKQSKVNGTFDDGDFAEKTVSGTSSNTGADADDDLSPTISPSLEATGMYLDSYGVTDMLEKPGPGRSSIRITEPSQPQRIREQKRLKEQQPEETKKQRQARARREREKEVQRETEAQRKVLEERQRRTAREAEGRPAKNGSGWTYASGLPANARSQDGSISASTPRSVPSDAPLLDTRDDASGVPAPSPSFQDDKGVSTPKPSEENARNTVDPNGRVDNDMTESDSNAQDYTHSLGKSTNITQSQESLASHLHPVNGNGISDASSNASSSHWESGLPPEEEQMQMFRQQSEDSAWMTVPTNKRAKRRPITEKKEGPVQTANEVSDFDVTI